MASARIAPFARKLPIRSAFSLQPSPRPTDTRRLHREDSGGIVHFQEAQAAFVIWLDGTRDLSPHTVRAYSSDVSALTLHLGLDSQVADISSDTIVEFVQAQRASGIRATTIRRRLAGLRCFCRWLVDNEYLDSDPRAHVALQIRKRRTLPRPVPPSDVAILLDFLRHEAGVPLSTVDHRPLEHPHEATTLLAVAVMFATGLRVSETVGIRCSDLDISDRSIRVVGKGSKERTVFFPGEWMSGFLHSFLVARSALDIEHPLLLFNRLGAPLSSAAMRARLDKAAHRAGIARHITPHMLRHSAATQLIESGVDIRYVQRLLGHSSLSTTEISTHVSDRALRGMVITANVLERTLTHDN